MLLGLIGDTCLHLCHTFRSNWVIASWEKNKNPQNVAAFRVLRAKKSCDKQCGKFVQRGICVLKSHIQRIHVKLNCFVKCKLKKKKIRQEKILSLKTCFCCLLFWLYIAWPWAQLWHDDTLSTLMVHDGIKALSGGHSRCSKPRPWVALDGRRAVIYVPHCQSCPPHLTPLKNLSICHISRGRPSARHAIFCHSQAHCRTQVLMCDSWQRKKGKKDNQHA